MKVAFFKKHIPSWKWRRVFCQGKLKEGFDAGRISRLRTNLSLSPDDLCGVVFVEGSHHFEGSFSPRALLKFQACKMPLKGSGSSELPAG
jgi:hypothetical protein